MKLSIVVALIIVASAFHAFAGGTDLEQFQKAVSKTAPFVTAKSKTLCICFDASRPKRIGQVTQNLAGGNVYFRCSVPSFDLLGVYVGSGSCSDFEMVR